MPYVGREDRSSLDGVIEEAVKKLMDTPNADSLGPAPGNLNYMISRIVAGCVGKVSYGKIAMATGVLENVKQELYRRMASPYEDEKIKINGDIPEYES